jgi:D-alanine-D-alanine ligase
MSTIAVVTGGSTPERDVALAGAAQVVAALRSAGHDVTAVDTVSGALGPAAEASLLLPTVPATPPDAATLAGLAAVEYLPDLVRVPAVRDADLVFLVLHGRQGEGGAVQALLELAGLRYVGSDAVGSAVAMDKDLSKRLLRDAGIPTAAWAMWPAEQPAIAALGLPLVVKPINVGSTVGLTVVKRTADLAAAVALAQQFDDAVMLEQFLPGREFTVGVLGDDALAVGEIIPSHEIFDYECKYTPGLTREIFPAAIAADLAAELRRQALAVHRTLKLRDFSRVDFRLAADGTPACLEVNTLPGLTRTSLLPQSAAAVGIDFPTLCGRLVRAGLARGAMTEQS